MNKINSIPTKPAYFFTFFFFLLDDAVDVKVAISDFDGGYWTPAMNL